RTGSWGEALRRAAAGSGLPAMSLVETRSLAECRKRLGEQSFGKLRTTSAGMPLLIELSLGSAAEVCEVLAWHARRCCAAPRIVVGSRESADYESLVREAGATSFHASPRDMRSCVAEYLRFRDDPTHRAEEDRRSLAERIRDSLPWRPVADAAANRET